MQIVTLTKFLIKMVTTVIQEVLYCGYFLRDYSQGDFLIFPKEAGIPWSHVIGVHAYVTST